MSLFMFTPKEIFLSLVTTRTSTTSYGSVIRLDRILGVTFRIYPFLSHSSRSVSSILID